MSEKRLPELSAEAQNIIGAAKHDGPSDTDRSRVRASVFAAIAGGAAATATTTAEAVTSSATAASASAAGASVLSMGLATKVIIGAALVVGVGAGLYAAKATSDSSPNHVAQTTPAAPAAMPTQAPAPAATPSAAALPPTASDSTPAAAEATNAGVTKTAAAVEAKPARTAPARTKATRAKATPKAPTASNPGSDELAQLEQERALLDVATKALRNGKPARALEVLGESTTLFPKPLLAQERRATRILALCAAGRADDARAAAEKFRKRYPSSAHLTRIDRACASL